MVSVDEAGSRGAVTVNIDVHEETVVGLFIELSEFALLGITVFVVRKKKFGCSNRWTE